MLLRQSVTCDGIEYVLVYRPTGRGSQGWAWVDGVRRNEVDPADVPLLRDAFLAQDVAVHGRPASLPEVRRLHEILKSMGADPTHIRKRLGIPEPRKCVDCRSITIDGYPGPRRHAMNSLSVPAASETRGYMMCLAGGRVMRGRASSVVVLCSGHSLAAPVQH